MARQYGASVPFLRTEETANDYATLADVIREVLDRYKEQGDFFDNMCCILATSPLLLNEDIVVGYERLIHSDFSSLVPMIALMCCSISCLIFSFSAFGIADSK